VSNRIRPFILVTNDDGIASPGLLAAIRCVLDLGEVWAVAPRVQQSGSGRSFPPHKVEAEESTLTVDGILVPAFALDTSPAQAVRHGLLCSVPRQPDLVVAGINYGENVGASVTISGTIGAAIEAAGFGIPTLAASLETEKQYHFGQSTEVDFSTAAVFVRRFAQWLLVHGQPAGVDLFKLDVPCVAKPDTPWRITRVSRQPYWVSRVVVDKQGRKHLGGYVRHIDLETLEPDSDVRAVAVDRVVSLTPLTTDLTASVNVPQLQNALSA
jgi:5'-nucleotidase